MILTLGQPGISIEGLALAGMVIGSLGVLDDVTVSQASTVMALRRARQAPWMIRGEFLNVAWRSRPDAPAYQSVSDVLGRELRPPLGNAHRLEALGYLNKPLIRWILVMSARPSSLHDCEVERA